MKGEQAKKLTNEAIEKLAKALETGKSEALTAFLRAAAKFRDYSFRNIMLIATQRPDATHVAGVNAWKRLNRFVKKGEKGIVIIAPMPFRRDTQPESESSAEETSDDGRSKVGRIELLYQGTKETLEASLGSIQDAAAQIISHLLEDPED